MALAAGGLGSTVAAAAPTVATRAGPGVDAAPGALRKCISMSGPMVLRSSRHPNDYRFWGNRRFFADTATTWVKLWVSWNDLQPDYLPRNREEAWLDLGIAPLGQAWLWRLDRQVRAANDDGVGVILALYHAHPHWASGATGDDPDSGRLAAQRLPRDLTPDGPWAWWLSYLCARYDGTLNPLGPHAPFPGEEPAGYDPRSGNPSGGRIDALEICNEPNTLAWPQEGLAGNVASMIRTAVELAGPSGPRILAPSALDAPDPDEPQAPRVRTDWHSFSEQVLEDLRMRPAAAPFGWSHHNYRDVARGVEGGESRARRVVDLLRRADWPDGQRPLVWLTEGGLNLYPAQGDPAARRRQAQLIRSSFEEMSRQPDVYMWTQHGLHDVADDLFKASLRDDFRPGEGPGRARPALAQWRSLPGATEP